MLHHEAVKLYYNEGTSLSVLFSDGITKRYDVMELAKSYKPLKALKDRKLFLKGKLSLFGIMWTNQLDMETETVYIEGTKEKNREDATEALLAHQIKQARLKKELTQEGLSGISEIDQADISKIENGKLSPTLNTIKRIARALDTTITLVIK